MHTLPQPHQNIVIIKDRLVFSVLRIQPTNTSTTFSFSIDNDDRFQYLPFFSDFGPPELSHIHNFCVLVNHYLSLHKETVQYVCGFTPQKIANAVLFISAYNMIHNNLSPTDAFAPVQHLASSLKPYRDASSFPSTYDLTVLHCLKGLHKAMQLGWYRPDNFNPAETIKYEQVENGDMNWLIPGKLLAFASPYATNKIQGGYTVSTPRELIPIFKQRGITRIVRLCQRFYDEKLFVNAGFKHTELYFLDGSVPPNEILNKFLDIVEGHDVVALHCKAGLGRTGTLAACYMIKNFGFDGDEAIGWIRICRPGSIIGPQQRYVLKFYELISQPSVPQSPVVSKVQVHTPTKILRKATEKPPPISTKSENKFSTPTHDRSNTERKQKQSTPTRERKSETSAPRTPNSIASMQEELAKHVTAVSLTPKHPQPRKYNRPK